MTSPSSFPAFSSEYRNASRGNEVIAAASIFIVTGILFTCLRAWARRLQEAPFMWGDAFVPVGLVFLITVCTLCIVMVTRGRVGRHTEVVFAYYPDTIPLDFKLLFYAVPCLYCVAVTMPKLAVLNLYLHVFRDQRARWSCYSIAAIVVLAAVVNIMTTIFQCNPIDQLWNPSPDGWCMDVSTKFQWASFPNMFTDVALLVIPIPSIMKLQVPTRIKVGVFVTFLTGSIGLASSIARFASFQKSTAEDPFWDGITPVACTIAEPGIYLVASCLVTMKPLLNYLIRGSSIAPLFSKTLTSSANLPLASQSNDQKEGVSLQILQVGGEPEDSKFGGPSKPRYVEGRGL